MRRPRLTTTATRTLIIIPIRRPTTRSARAAWRGPRARTDVRLPARPRGDLSPILSRSCVPRPISLTGPPTSPPSPGASPTPAGMPDIVADLAWSVDAASAGRAALARGAPVLCDARMVVAGIAQNRLPRANAVLCRLDGVASGASAPRAMTRSAAAVELWRGDLDGAVVAIGNAPTALFRLIELMAEGAPKPPRSSPSPSASSARPKPRRR